VALVVQVHTEIVSRVDVTDIARGNPDDRLVSVAIGDDRSAVRLVGQVRDVYSVVVEVDRERTRPTNIGGAVATRRRVRGQGPRGMSLEPWPHCHHRVAPPLMVAGHTTLRPDSAIWSRCQPGSTAFRSSWSRTERSR
jgi:hypothetical protein